MIVICENWRLTMTDRFVQQQRHASRLLAAGFSGQRDDGGGGGGARSQLGDALAIDKH